MSPPLRPHSYLDSYNQRGVLDGCQLVARVESPLRIRRHNDDNLSYLHARR